jgi:hypothetical protein
MRTEEKNTKRTSRRGNVLDIVIVLLLLAAIATVGYRYYQSVKEVEQDAQQDVLITFEVKQLLSDAKNKIKDQETLFLDSTGESFGILQKHENATEGSIFSVRAAQVTVQDENGNYVTLDHPDSSLIDVVGSVTCRGRLSEDGSFLLDGRTPITPGQTISVHTEQVSFVLTVVRITSAVK